MDKKIRSILSPYEKYILNTRIDEGFFFLFESLNRFIDSIEMYIYISENPAFVLDNIYRIISLSGKCKILNIKNVTIIRNPKNQKVVFVFKEKKLTLNYDILLQSNIEILHYILLNTDTILSLEMLAALFKGSKLSHIMLNSKDFLEEAMKKDTDIDKLIYIYLTIITVKVGGNFNRAILFQKKGDTYEVTRAFGFVNEKEAHEVWEGLEETNYDFKKIIKDYKPKEYFSSLEKKIKYFKLREDEMKDYKLFKEFLDLGIAVQIPVSILPHKLIHEIDILGECAICPLRTENKDFGFVLVDNRYNHQSISREQIYTLDYFSKHMVVLWENKLFIDALKFEAEKDFLTGFYNRRSLDKYIESLTLSRKNNIGIAMIDLDDFKQINDTYGHGKGDKVIKVFSDIVFKNIRKEDKAFRYGGDEFVLIFEMIDEENLFGILNRINYLFKKITGFSFSSGSTICKDSSNIYDCFKKVDELLYEVKRTSKGRINIK
ncbi:diguanylate cyclase (GGDEF) domain-containing protein [Marinitoga hydrogenitolerans DSM 16785]|uniref:Diguanylate cyclase (GGDEF) domain-containing protein n=1 Tax=Marinitoga hydrogenitolerans (strain DSM 16785 / JCM 12826 / AT1271) TaxID=1122195 RepID=A0A1M4S9L9_MARH1|nr:GGDEF domain-containing protein [Marinitoga hydrogenitolerans]SHE28747.1 diguanylate cyclase (GGDEF) domain-containing protein [Marinitoga hydrogenitolerans DSM 16785]